MGRHRLLVETTKPKYKLPSIALALVFAGVWTFATSSSPELPPLADVPHAEMLVPVETQTPQQIERVSQVRRIVEEQEPITLSKVYEAARLVEPQFTEITVIDYLSQYPIEAPADLSCKEGFEPRNTIVIDAAGIAAAEVLCYKMQVQTEVAVAPIVFPSLVDIDDYSADAGDRGWGRGWPSDHPNVTVTSAISGTRVNVEPRIARLVELLINETERRGYLIDPGDVSSYSNRPIAGTDTASNHSWALAADFNVSRNPQTNRLVTDMPDWMPELWNSYGFAWGGHYGSGTLKDAMHYEFMGTPANAAELTTIAERNLVPQPPEIVTEPGILEPVGDLLDGVGDLLGG